MSFECYHHIALEIYYNTMEDQNLGIPDKRTIDITAFKGMCPQTNVTTVQRTS